MSLSETPCHRLLPPSSWPFDDSKTRHRPQPPAQDETQRTFSLASLSPLFPFLFLFLCIFGQRRQLSRRHATRANHTPTFTRLIPSDFTTTTFFIFTTYRFGLDQKYRIQVFPSLFDPHVRFLSSFFLPSNAWCRHHEAAIYLDAPTLPCHPDTFYSKRPASFFLRQSRPSRYTVVMLQVISKKKSSRSCRGLLSRTRR